MKKIYLTLIAVAFMACNHLEEGTVINMHYEPATKNLMLIPMKVGDITILQQFWVHDNEDWVLTIQGYDGTDLIHENVYVSKECYNQMAISDTWHITDECSFSDDNNHKVKAKKN